MPEWPQDFKENLLDESVQPHQYSPSSSHELPMEPRAKVELGSGKHSIYGHFPKYRNCDICLRTNITRASCRRRTGTVVPREEKLSDLITADHNVLSKGCESRHKSSICCGGTRLGNAVVTIVPMQNKNFPGNPEEPNEVPGADEETKSHLH